MASIKCTPSGHFQLCVRNKLLPKPLWATFDTREEAERYGTHLERLLSQGIVPAVLLEQRKLVQECWTIMRCIAEYVRHNSVPVSEVKLLDTLSSSVATVSTAVLNYDWAEAWVKQMKRDQNLAPSTIRHRHGALARCFDWVVRKHPEIMVQNPLRLLKRGFATYTAEDAKVLAASEREAKIDVERDRRLEPSEEQRILRVLEGDADMQSFFVLAIETAMRMRECYTLHIDQLGFQKRTIHLDRSKNGDARQVPMSSVVCQHLKAYVSSHAEDIKSRHGRLFPFWDGDKDVRNLDRTTREVSRIFKVAFVSAKVEDFNFHDLRHEATCRFFEKTTLSDTLIAKITGHRDPRMLKRYASLRGSDLAAHLW